jgi:hypothetical protein
MDYLESQAIITVRVAGPVLVLRVLTIKPWRDKIGVAAGLEVWRLLRITALIFGRTSFSHVLLASLASSYRYYLLIVGKGSPKLDSFSGKVLNGYRPP